MYFRENVEKNLPPNIVLAYLPERLLHGLRMDPLDDGSQKADYFTAHDPDAWKAMKKAPAFYDDAVRSTAYDNAGVDGPAYYRRQIAARNGQ